jgi:hypothetical protein
MLRKARILVNICLLGVTDNIASVLCIAALYSLLNDLKYHLVPFFFFFFPENMVESLDS